MSWEEGLEAGLNTKEEGPEAGIGPENEEIGAPVKELSLDLERMVDDFTDLGEELTEELVDLQPAKSVEQTKQGNDYGEEQIDVKSKDNREQHDREKKTNSELLTNHSGNAQEGPVASSEPEQKQEVTEAPLEPQQEPEVTKAPFEHHQEPEVTKAPLEPQQEPEITKAPLEHQQEPEVTKSPLEHQQEPEVIKAPSEHQQGHQQATVVSLEPQQEQDVTHLSLEPQPGANKSINEPCPDKRNEDEERSSAPNVLSTVALFQAKASQTTISPETTRPGYSSKGLDPSLKSSPRGPQKIQASSNRLISGTKSDEHIAKLPVDSSNEDQDLPLIKVSELKKRFEQ